VYDGYVPSQESEYYKCMMYMYLSKNNKLYILLILEIYTINRGRTVFFNGGNDDNLHQNICFDHV
jgi:hypothetical protein